MSETHKYTSQNVRTMFADTKNVGAIKIAFNHRMYKSTPPQHKLRTRCTSVRDTSRTK